MNIKVQSLLQREKGRRADLLKRLAMGGAWVLTVDTLQAVHKTCSICNAQGKFRYFLIPSLIDNISSSFTSKGTCRNEFNTICPCLLFEPNQATCLPLKSASILRSWCTVLCIKMCVRGDKPDHAVGSTVPS